MSKHLAVTARWLVVAAERVLEDHGIICEDEKFIMNKIYRRDV